MKKTNNYDYNKRHIHKHKKQKERGGMIFSFEKNCQLSSFFFFFGVARLAIFFFCFGVQVLWFCSVRVFFS